MQLLLTLRDGEVEGMGPLHTLGSFEDSPEVDRIEVPGLDVPAVVELIRQVVGPAGRRQRRRRRGHRG